MLSTIDQTREIWRRGGWGGVKNIMTLQIEIYIYISDDDDDDGHL